MRQPRGKIRRRISWRSRPHWPQRTRPDSPGIEGSVGDLMTLHLMTYIAVTVDLVTNLKLLHFVADHLDDASNVEARDCVPNRPSQL